MMNTPSEDTQSSIVPVIKDSIHEKTSSSLPQHPPASEITNQFPWRLHQMLETVEMEGNSSIISWMPGNPQNTFKVHNKDVFMEQVMPRFFNQTKFKSFLRQLNLWGFERILESGPMRGGYRHSLFIKNQPRLCNQMKRTKIKGSKQVVGSGESQQMLARMVHQEHANMLSRSTRTIDVGRQHHLAVAQSTGLHDEPASFETIEYEKIPNNVPLAADLSRMYAEDMGHSPPSTSAPKKNND